MSLGTSDHELRQQGNYSAPMALRSQGHPERQLRIKPTVCIVAWSKMNSWSMPA